MVFTYRGKRHGEWSLWYEDGTMKENGEFEMGEINGTYKYWYNNGHLHMEQSTKMENQMESGPGGMSRS